MRDTTGHIIAFEQGELDKEETIDLFQDFIDDGTVWRLQGSYGRTAARRIEAGYCSPANQTQAAPVSRL